MGILSTGMDNLGRMEEGSALQLHGYLGNCGTIIGQKLISGHHVIQQRRGEGGGRGSGHWLGPEAQRAIREGYKAVPGSLSSMHQKPIVLLCFSLKFDITQ